MYCSTSTNGPEAEFLDETRQKSEEFNSLIFTFYSSNSRNLLRFSTIHCKGERRKTWWEPFPLSYDLRNPYRNLKSEKTLKIMPGNLNKIVRLWFRLLLCPAWRNFVPSVSSFKGTVHRDESGWTHESPFKIPRHLVQVPAIGILIPKQCTQLCLRPSLCYMQFLAKAQWTIHSELYPMAMWTL